MSSASKAFEGLPFQTYILGAPQNISVDADAHKDVIRPVMLRVDAQYYSAAMDEVEEDKVEFLVMAGLLHPRRRPEGAHTQPRA